MKASKKLIIIIATVLVLVIGGGAVYATNTPIARAERQINLGNKYLQEGKYQEAILAFQKVIEIELKNIPARLGLGNAYIATKEFTKAETVLKEVIGIDPKNMPAREELFNVYIKEGNLDKANAILKEITTLDPRKDTKHFNADLDSAKAISTSKANYDQGIKQIGDKQYLEAVDSFQKVIKEDTERYTDAQTKIVDCKKAFVDATLQKAKDSASNEDYNKALNLLDQVLKIDSNNQEALKLKNDYIKKLRNKTEQETSAKTEGLSSNDILLDVSQGRIPEVKFTVGTPFATIFAQLGRPQKEAWLPHSYHAMFYGSISYDYYDPSNKKDVNTLSVERIVVYSGGKALGFELGNVTFDDIQNVLGKTKDGVVHYASDPDGITYKIGTHQVGFFSSNGNIVDQCRLY